MKEKEIIGRARALLENLYTQDYAPGQNHAALPIYRVATIESHIGMLPLEDQTKILSKAIKDPIILDLEKPFLRETYKVLIGEKKKVQDRILLMHKHTKTANDMAVLVEKAVSPTTPESTRSASISPEQHEAASHSPGPRTTLQSWKEGELSGLDKRYIKDTAAAAAKHIAPKTTAVLADLGLVERPERAKKGKRER